MIEESFGRILGCDKILLSYVLHENDTNDFDGNYDIHREKLSPCLNHSGS